MVFRDVRAARCYPVKNISFKRVMHKVEDNGLFEQLVLSTLYLQL